jgi:hypothetical protein
MSPAYRAKTAKFEAVIAQVNALSPRQRKEFDKYFRRVMRQDAAAAEVKPKTKKDTDPGTWRLEKSRVSPAAASQQITPATRKLTTAKRLHVPPPSLASEET